MPLFAVLVLTVGITPAFAESSTERLERLIDKTITEIQHHENRIQILTVQLADTTNAEQKASIESKIVNQENKLADKQANLVRLQEKLEQAKIERINQLKKNIDHLAEQIDALTKQINSMKIELRELEHAAILEKESERQAYENRPQMIMTDKLSYTLGDIMHIEGVRGLLSPIHTTYIEIDGDNIWFKIYDKRSDYLQAGDCNITDDLKDFICDVELSEESFGSHYPIPGIYRLSLVECYNWQCVNVYSETFTIQPNSIQTIE